MTLGCIMAVGWVLSIEFLRALRGCAKWRHGSLADDACGIYQQVDTFLLTSGWRAITH